MLFPENVSFCFYLPWAICYLWFLRQPLKTMVSLLLRLEGQEIIKRRIHSSLGMHLPGGYCISGWLGWRTKGTQWRWEQSPTGCPPGGDTTLQCPRQPHQHFRAAHQLFHSFQKVKQKGGLHQSQIFTLVFPLYFSVYLNKRARWLITVTAIGGEQRYVHLHLQELAEWCIPTRLSI